VVTTCRNCGTSRTTCQAVEGCCSYCLHAEPVDVNATDAAVTAAAEAIDGPGSTYLIQRGHVDIDDVARVVAAARPIIEAEVRERIAAEREAEFQHIATFGGAEPPAFMDAAQRAAYDLGYHDGAARIARGQS